MVVPILCDIALVIFHSLLRKGEENYVKKRKIMGIIPNGVSHTQRNIRRSSIRSFGLSDVRHKCKKVFHVRKMGKYRSSASLKSKDNNLELSSKLDNDKLSERNLIEQGHIKWSTQNCMIFSEDNNYLSDSRSSTSENNNGNLKDSDGKSPAMANDCFKSPDEGFSTLNDSYIGFNIGNFDKYRYINASKAGEITEKSNMENIMVQNSECNVEDSFSRGRMSIGNLQKNSLLSVGCTGHAMFEGGSENVGSAEGSEKPSINSKISIVDDQKLGKIFALNKNSFKFSSKLV